jgi:hypothetical protein
MFAAVISLSSAKINCGRPLLDRRVHMSGATTRRCLIQRLAPVVIALIIAAYAQAAAPRLYRQPAYESTVRGEPDDLLLIAGYGLSKDDRVVYRAVNASQMVHPGMPPASSDARSGVADVVNKSNVPYSLTVRLPGSLVATQTYELWVVTAQQEWSEPVRINDARPLWLSPAVIYAREPDSAARYMKVVGRNLNPAQDGPTEVRLLGASTLTLAAEPASAEDSSLDRYVARVKLPPILPIGDYRVQVRRDKFNWVEVPGQRLNVRANPAESIFAVNDPAYGGCKADDGMDDAPCIVRAVAAAQAAGGGTVSFGPGTWNLSARPEKPSQGILIPRGVSLQGAGRSATTIMQNADGTAAAAASFTLLGSNTVSGFAFRDAHVYSAQSPDNAMIVLGRGPDAARPQENPVSDVVIEQNLFDRPNIAVSDSGVAIARLRIAGNEFRAYRRALNLGGSRYLVNDKFQITDSQIDHNLFKPGSYLAMDIVQGAIASEVGASTRVDFSNNIADGASADGLYAPTDAHGWRAAFFWHLNNNQEMVLVSQNSASCTGDKDGDGEALSFDNNANTFGLPGAAAVLRADADSVTVQGALAKQQNDREIKIPDYYVGHWLQVGAGPGLGQVRKIVSYTENSAQGTVTFKVAPSWDVVPVQEQTRINVGREFWQVYAIANEVDHRQPLCQKSNRTANKGGSISFWAQNADSVIEGNRQHDTDGIIFQQYYNAEESGCSACGRATFYADFLEIRANSIDGEYDWDDDCSSSGIFASMAAGPTLQSTPATVGFGTAISHNVVSHADGREGGAISFQPTWLQGPPPHRWRLVDSTLIFRNTLRNLDGAPARGCKGAAPHPRTAISLGAAGLMQDSTLYGNSCADARRALVGRAADLMAVCPAGATSSCECRAP